MSDASSKTTRLVITALVLSGSLGQSVAQAQTPTTTPAGTGAATPATANPAKPSSTDDSPSATPANALTAALTSALQSPLKIGTQKIDVESLKNLYLLRAYKPIFVSPTGTLDITQSLRVTLTSSSVKNGLRAGDYWSAELDARMKATNTQSLVELELLLAQNFLRYATDLSSGRLNPQDDSQNISDIEFKKRSFKDFALLNSIAEDSSSMSTKLQELAPQNVTYLSLMRVLAKLLSAKENGGWPALKQTKILKPGMNDASIPGIRMRLVDLGLIKDEQERTNASLNYDSVVAKGVQFFQRDLKLSSDGVIGKTTFTALNTTVDSKIDQVRANLERWRLLPRDFGERYIQIDLGQQEFSLYNKNNLDIFMRVVVGQEARQTPSFMDQVTDVVVNPYWHAPPSIVVKDILPKVIQDPYYWEEMHIRVFQGNREIDPSSVDWSRYSLTNQPPFSFREEPGDNNSLGRLKFNLSMNHHSIYMHDTNHRELFDQDNRMYSSGCIRLEDPRRLADYLLEAQGIDDSSLVNMIDDPRVVAKTISLKNPIKVYILSNTITVTPNGMMRFGRDIYNQDKRLAAALNGERVDPSNAVKPPDEGAP